MALFRIRRHKGTFLLEALVAVVILAVGLTGVIRAFLMGLKAQERSRDYQISALILENVLTHLLLDRYFDEGISAGVECARPYADYRCEITAEELDPPGPLKRVTVSVIRLEGSNGRLMEAVTYMFARPKDEEGEFYEDAFQG